MYSLKDSLGHLNMLIVCLVFKYKCQAIKSVYKVNGFLSSYLVSPIQWTDENWDSTQIKS